MELPDNPRWHNQALCKGTKDPVFFPLSPASEEVAAKEAARKYCNFCPVGVECLRSALIKGDVGIWAGTHTDLRSQLRRIRSRVKCPNCRNKQLIAVNEHSLCLSCGLSWVKEKSNG